MGLFDRFAIESKSATPIQRTVSQANLDSDSGSSTILLGTLWSASEASDEDGQSRPRYCDAQHVIHLLGPPAAQTPSAQSSGVASFMPGVGRQADFEQPTDPIPRTFPIISRYFEQKRGTVQSRAVYDAVFALLAELQWRAVQIQKKIVRHVPPLKSYVN
ncbi:MAG: hypothetical protein LQ341_002719, partial [Variospora aurantia]